MKRLILLLLLCLTARADVLRIESFVYPINAGPARITLDSGPVQLWMCMDYERHISVPSSWEVQEFNLGGNLTGARFFDGANIFLFYQAAFLLQTALSAPQEQQASINMAMQRLFNDSPNLITPQTTYWLEQAHGGAFGINFSNFVILSPTGSYGQCGIIMVPEPAFYACFAIGLVSLIGFHRLGRKKK